MGEAGQVVLDQNLQRIVDNIADAIDSVNATASDLIDLFGGIAESPSFFNESLTKIVRSLRRQGVTATTTSTCSPTCSAPA